MPSVISNVEDLTGDVVEEGNVTTDSFGDKCFSSPGQADHYDDEFVGCGGADDFEGGGVLALGDDVWFGIINRVHCYNMFVL